MMWPSVRPDVYTSPYMRFKHNCTSFGSLLEKLNMKLTKWEDLEVRMNCTYSKQF